jgi:hypothetical protein
MESSFYFKYVSIDNYKDIVAEFQPYILKHVEGFKMGFHLMNPAVLLDNCPIFSQWIISNKFKIRIVGIVITPPYTNSPTHIDYINKDFSVLALNMEIQNCRIPKTKMYITDATPHAIKLAHTPENVEYWKYENNDSLKEVGKFDLTQPVLFNTQIPHQVCNQTSERRVSISFRFYEDPVLIAL